MSPSIRQSTTKTKERPPLSEESDEGDLYDSGDDADAPRISQWVDEDDLEMPTSSSPVAGPSKLHTQGRQVCISVSAKRDMLMSIQLDLSTLPMGALRHAQRVMKQHESSSESEGSDSSSDTDEEGEHDETVQSHSAREGKQRERKEVGKRSSKHAPMETSSKKPVTRRRTVVDVKVPEVRDPRFLPMTGQLSVEKFQSNYDFLTKSHGTELKTLRENLKRARKLLSNSPRDLRPEREAEVARLELAMKRAESVVNRDRQQHAERTALSKVKKEEQEKRKHGKGQWHMKDSAKKEVLAKARYEALAAEGGQRAVKKAIEKKRKKISQKEKRSRPDGVGGFARSSDPDRPQKRRKVG